MAKFYFTSFIRDQWTTLPVVKYDLTGKTVVVVGANTGLGKEAARHFATMNPGKLILACRSKERGEAALQDIKSTTGCKTLEVWELDLANFSTIRSFVDKFEKEGQGLDILVENAGIGTSNFEQTKDGWERTLQINHLGTALLAILLLPTLVKGSMKGPMPRISIVSSGAHYMVARLKEAEEKHILNTLNDVSVAGTIMTNRYEVSKLLNVFFTRALASRLPIGSPLTVNVLNPGFCKSELSREASGLRRLVSLAIMRIWLARSTEMGSRNILYAALEGTQRKMQGRYLDTCEVREESDYVVSEEGGKVEDRLWNETVDILKRVDPRVDTVVKRYLRAD